MGKKQTIEDIKSKVKAKFGDKVEVIGDFVNTATPLKFHCNVCGNDYERRIYTVLNSPVGSCMFATRNITAKTNQNSRAIP